MASLQSPFITPTQQTLSPLPTRNTKRAANNLFFSPPLKACPKTRIHCSSLSSLSPQIQEQLIPDQEQPEIFTTEEEPIPLHETWPDIHGRSNWADLLDPMDPLLRQEIIRYGEMAQACYDSFDFDPNSKYCGTCKYPGSHFFQRLGTGRGYTLTRYLYATSNINLPNFFQKSDKIGSVGDIWSQHANWMGYVAVATDEDEIRRLGRRDITIAWRGTVTYLEWIHDLKDILCPAHFRKDPSIKIESGFFDLYTTKESACQYCSFSAREQVLAEVRRIIHRYRGEDLSITITGHSLGAALALLSAYDIAEMKLNFTDEGDHKKIPVTVFSFSGPRVGNLKFKERCDFLGIRVLRIINVHDKVPKVPGIITNEKFRHQKYIEDKFSFPWSYAHVGVELALDHTQSPFLKHNSDVRNAHNLEAHLHLLDGYHGKDKEFSSVGGRDIALVNKGSDFLTSDCGVPPNWWQDEHKGMVRTVDGRWGVPERPRVEAHPPDTAHHFEQVIKFARSKLELF